MVTPIPSPHNCAIPKGAEQLKQIMDTDPLVFQLNMMCSYLNVKPEERYALLAEQDVEQRIDAMLELIVREANFAELERELNEKVKIQVDKHLHDCSALNRLQTDGATLLFSLPIFPSHIRA